MKTLKLASPVESFYFEIPNYGLDHLTGAIVDVHVNLDFNQDIGAPDPKAYPEFVSIANFIQEYLVSYPNETDSWEVANKNLVTALLTRTIPTSFGVEYNLKQLVEALTVELIVHPGSSLIDYPRESVIIGFPDPENGGNELYQSFSFSIPNYGIDHQDGAILDLHVDLDFKEDIAIDDPSEVPDFVAIVNTIKQFLLAYPNKDDYWEVLNKNLVESLMTQAILSGSGAQYNLNQLVEFMAVTLDVQPGSSLVKYPRSSAVTAEPDSSGINYDQFFSFQIPAYGLDHQDGAIVNLTVDLDFKNNIGITNPNDFPEFVSIVNFIQSYLVSYPNENDFWEILNKNLVNTLLTQAIPTTFGVEYNLSQLVDTLTVTLDVEQGSSLVNYPRSSKVVGVPIFGLVGFDQSFSFSILDYGLDHQNGAIIDLFVELDFKADIAATNPFDYPEFVSIVNFIKNYLVTYPNETDFWEILNKNLVDALLTETIPTTFGAEYRLRELVDSITVDLDVKSGSSLVNYPRSSSVYQSVYVAGELTPIAADILAISNGDSAGDPTLEISIASSSGNSIYEFAVFTVDDAQGSIDGLPPGAAGYAQAAVGRAQTIFSTLANLPSGYDPKSMGRSMQFSNGDKLRFLLVKNNTLDSLRRGDISSSDLLFADPSTLTMSEAGSGNLRLAWKEANGSSSDFNELVVNLQASDTEMPLGTNRQAQREGEVLDFSSISATSTVQASFAVTREAAYNNYVGFYRVSNSQGSILDPITGASFNPGDAGYTQAAVRNRIAGIDLRTPNQATTRLEGVFQGGEILAPFIVVNGTPEQLLDANPNNDPTVYFPYLNANADRRDHIRLLASNTFGFEDMPGGGDFDFNDIIIQVMAS